VPHVTYDFETKCFQVALQHGGVVDIAYAGETNFAALSKIIQRWAILTNFNWEDPDDSETKAGLSEIEFTLETLGCNVGV